MDILFKLLVVGGLSLAMVIALAWWVSDGFTLWK